MEGEAQVAEQEEVYFVGGVAVDFDIDDRDGGHTIGAVDEHVLPGRVLGQQVHDEHARAFLNRGRDRDAGR